jgi:hypothetical protein
MTAGESVNFRNANLEVFLNLAQYFEDTDQRGIVTLLLEPTTSSTVASFYSHEGSVALVGDETLAPRLVLQAAGVPGDFNLDGNVDATDYVVWRKTDGSPDDYNAWRANFGRTLFNGSGAGASARAAVPEPTTFVLLIFAVAGVSCNAGPHRKFQQVADA